MNAITLLVYAPIAVIFFAFVLVGGLIIPLWDITEPLRDRRPRGPDRAAVPLPTVRERSA